jgi:hyperosmotically inducible protein
MHVNKLIRLIPAVAFVLASFAAVAAAQDRSAGTAINDAWITTQIHAKFFADADVKGRNIDVDTSSGVVTLSGEVHSANERAQALAKAKSVDGVTRVVDKLTLTPGDPPASAEARDKAAKAKDKVEGTAGKAKAEWPKKKAEGKDAMDRTGNAITDTWITTKIQSKYFLDTDVKGINIDVDTKEGVVTLTGTVGSPAVQKEAVALARSTDGVKQVVDKLVVK